VSGRLLSPGGRLSRRRIAVPDHESLDPLAALLDEEGAIAVRCSLTRRQEPDPTHVETGLAALVIGGFECVVFQTGEGVACTLHAAEQMGLKADILSALGRVTKLVRSEAAASGLHAVDLAPDVRVEAALPDGMIEALARRDLASKLVAMEITGSAWDVTVMDYLQQAGAHVFPLLPYRCPAPDDTALSSLVEDVCGGGIDAAVFTAAMQLERLFGAARRRGLVTNLRVGLAHVHVAAVGPVALASLRRRRVRVGSVASRTHFSRAVIEALACELGPAHR
jgi:uroporphyrinogen-III synthase